MFNISNFYTHSLNISGYLASRSSCGISGSSKYPVHGSQAAKLPNALKKIVNNFKTDSKNAMIIPP